MTNTNGNGAGNGAGSSDGIFTKPAPEGAAKRMREVLGETCPRTCSDGSSG